ncbi:hypothetical protein AVEN_52943-1 [Araneus ventricosus]|uniref:Uncharacterized protein n=1 Tax=Araneus ventricosus TaxID=182803 RepID=A0A4Y2PNV2_ARAVE|nr:hypothetical protein AVEN_52943-1 [Araneus ventricosus]
MTRVEPFGKVEERFASQKETTFSVRFTVRFAQAFITSLFQAFQKVVQSPPSEDKTEPPCRLRSRTPTEGSNSPFLTPSSKPCSYRGVQPPFLSPLLLTLS